MKVLFDAVGQAAQSVAQQAEQVATEAVQATEQTVQTATDTIESSANIASGYVASSVEQGQQYLDQCYTTAVTDVARGVAGAGARAEEFATTVADNLRSLAPSWDEVERIHTTLRAIPEAVGAFVEPDVESMKHNGEVWIIDANAQPPDPTMRQAQPGENDDVIYYCNGMGTSPENAKKEALALSHKTGKPVVLVYSARQGFLQDLAHGLTSKADPFGLVLPDEATEAQTDLLYAAAKSGEPQTFVAYSRGTIVTRNALIRTHTRLYAEYYMESLKSGASPVHAHNVALRQANADMQNIHVVTAASAAWTWPPYANVEHVTNTLDLIPNSIGQNVLTDPRESFYEMFGYDLEWLPTSENHHMINDGMDDETGIGHSFLTTYFDDVIECL